MGLGRFSVGPCCGCGEPAELGCDYKPWNGAVTCTLPRRDLWLTTDVGGFPLTWITNIYFTGWYALPEWTVPAGNTQFAPTSPTWGSTPPTCGDGGLMRWLIRVPCGGGGQSAGGTLFYCIAGSNQCRYRAGQLVWRGTGGTGTAPDGAGEPNLAVPWPLTGTPSLDRPQATNLYADAPPTCDPLSYPLRTSINSLPLYGGLGKMTITE